jgi:6-phosphogluconolactonase
VIGNIRKYKDAQGAAEACGAYILERLAEAVDQRGTASLAISGGSTPKLMFEAMAKTPFDWKNVHLFWVDERPVPPEHEQSNFRLANEYLITPAGIVNVHRIPAELPPDHAASQYVKDVRGHFHLNEGEVPVFDVIHLGIGADAHTASLFPGEVLIENREDIAAAVYVDKLQQWRITLLPAVLLAAREAVVLAAGADKRQPLEQVLNGTYSPLKYPSQVVMRRTNHPLFFVDTTATE